MIERHQTSALRACLRAVWRRTQRKQLAAGLLAAGRWAVILFLATVAIDWLADLPAWGRGLAAAILVGMAVERGWRLGWRALRRFNPAAIAAEVETRQGGMESLLVTAEQFDRCGAAPGTSAALWKLTQQKAEDAASRLRPAAIITFGDLRGPLVAAAALVAVVAGLATVNGPFLAAGATRLFAPWLAVSYPTSTRIDLDQGDIVIKEGSRAGIVARLSGVIPDEATVLLQTGAGRPREVAVAVADGRCEYVLASAARDFDYRIKAGDARSEWHRVRVIPAPHIEDVRVALDYPDYLGRPTETVESLTLTVPENTALRWQLTLDRPVREAILHRDGEDPKTLAVSDDGRQVVLDGVATASGGYVFSWVEREHGFDFTSPRSYLTVAADQPPRVELTSPAENLNALVGRRLRLAVRAQDDHGLGPATITCRVNQRPEKVIPLAATIGNNAGEQPLDWDYREALPDLKEGDTVSFVVEVADRYPGADGPHRARTEPRRISFLSRADYLAEIRKRMDRILSKVRTTYRQERVAHEFVRGLDPGGASFVASAQLEAVRQEMIREQLQATADDVRALLDDLAANEITDVVEAGSLESLDAELRSIAADEVAAAANLLREQAAEATAGPADATPAIGKVNAAARRLATVVLRRGLDAAREVFARESRMLAEEQARLRVRSFGGAAGDVLGAAQADVASWTEQLLAGLDAGIRRDQRPLATLAFTRRIKDLRASGVGPGMREAANILRAGKPAEAALYQLATIPPLLAAEFSVRTGAEYATLLELRSLLEALMTDQQRLLRDTDAEESPAVDSLAARQEQLLEKLALALLPEVPAPRPRLLDDLPPAVPPVADIRSAAEQGMREAVMLLRSGERETATARQQQTLEALAGVREIVARRVTELGTMTAGLSTLVTAASDRALRLEEFEARQIGILEQMEEFALDGKSPATLAEPQRLLATDLARFHRDIAGSGAAVPAKDAVPLLGRIERAATAMAAAERAVLAGKADEAIEPQEQAANLLAEARQVSEAQRARLALLQELLAFREAVGFAATSMGDIIAEQRELVSAATGADDTACEQLLPRARDLAKCLVEVAPALDLVAGLLDAGTPLLFAGSDAEDAVAALEDGDGDDAAEILADASESLAKVQQLIAAVQTQTGYVAEIVEHLHESDTEVAELLFRQGQIRERLGLPDASSAELVAEQEKLRADAEAFGNRLERVTGRVSFAAAAGLMADALAPLRSGRATDAASCMERAETTLREQAAELSLMITVLHGLSAIEVTAASPAEMHRLIAGLAVAAEQRQLSRRTQAAGAGGDLGDLAAAERAIVGQAAAIPSGAEPHSLLVAAAGRLAAAAASLQASAWDVAVGHQRLADDLLRHFVIDQSMLLISALTPSSSSGELVLTEVETDDLYESTANFVSDFVSGEAPKDKRTEWEVLGARNRAALNQNFARELPLEYRATLKNYYERVAK